MTAMATAILVLSLVGLLFDPIRFLAVASACMVLNPMRDDQELDGGRKRALTRAYWMLVRSGDMTPEVFICPSSGDTAIKNENPGLYYDFKGYENVSYGYQVPFGPRDTRAREGMNAHQVVAADKGPFG